MDDKLEVVEESDGLGGYVYVVKERVEEQQAELWCHYGDLPSPEAYKTKEKFHISGMAWIPSYRDFDQYDTTVQATSKEDAIDVFNKTNRMASFMKNKPCVQTEQEWIQMCKRLKEMSTTAPSPESYSWLK